MPMARVAALALAFCAACASPPVVRRTAADIERVETLPVGHVALGGASARCATAPSWGRLDAEPLTRFECQPSVLERALAEQAAARGGTLLSGLLCRRSGKTLACTATIAAPAEGTSSLAESDGVATTVTSDELGFETARAIEVDLEPLTEQFARRARRADEVGVQLAVPVSHRPLGSLTARCAKNDCDSRDLRVALRVAAGALGVSDMAEVACGFRRDDVFCVATLAAAELDPETDPRAR
jgi:hypothetical protein